MRWKNSRRSFKKSRNKQIRKDKDKGPVIMIGPFFSVFFFHNGCAAAFDTDASTSTAFDADRYTTFGQLGLESFFL
jgi:hypothetical protein